MLEGQGSISRYRFERVFSARHESFGIVGEVREELSSDGGRFETESACDGGHLRLNTVACELCDYKELSKQTREESNVPEEFSGQESALSRRQGRINNGL